MDGVPQTTFIPRKPVSDSAQSRSGGTGKFLIFSIILFTLVALVSAAAFGYQYYLNNQLKKTQASLNQTLTQFDPGLVAQMSSLSTHIQTAQSILQNHLALSTFFTFLATNTVRSVRFNAFTYSVANNQMSISLTGQATDFSALEAEKLQLQQDTSGFLENPTISNISLTDSGAVSFTLNGALSPTAASYQNEIDGPPANANPAAASSTVQTP